MLEDRYRAVQERIAAAAERAGRDPADVTLVAVSKRHPVDAIRRLYDAGHRDFGESRVQELAEKAPLLPGDVRWHFVGAIQRNKVRKIRPLAHLVHSFDRPEIADAWTRDSDASRGSGEPAPGGADAPGVPAPPVLLQVNVGGEMQKQGVRPEDAEDAVSRLADAGVHCAGVMTLPPRVADAEAARPFFRDLRAVRDALAARWPSATALSMGMSADFEVAVEEGATHVRVGTGLFGPRA